MLTKSTFTAGVADDARVVSQVTVDYLGRRVCAQSRLPISSDTLVYGSSDQGRTVRASDPDFNAMMRAACSQLNLAAHASGNAPNMSVVWGCCDVEGHRIPRHVPLVTCAPVPRSCSTCKTVRRRGCALQR